jgi:hypothetical protein
MFELCVGRKKLIDSLSHGVEWTAGIVGPDASGFHPEYSGVAITWSIFSVGGRVRFLRRTYMTMNTAITTIAPTTPPAMAAVFVFGLCEGVEEVDDTVGV